MLFFYHVILLTIQCISWHLIFRQPVIFKNDRIIVTVKLLCIQSKFCRWIFFFNSSLGFNRILRNYGIIRKTWPTGETINPITKQNSHWTWQQIWQVSLPGSKRKHRSSWATRHSRRTCTYKINQNQTQRTNIGVRMCNTIFLDFRAYLGKMGKMEFQEELV